MNSTNPLSSPALTTGGFHITYTVASPESTGMTIGDLDDLVYKVRRLFILAERYFTVIEDGCARPRDAFKAVSSFMSAAAEVGHIPRAWAGCGLLKVVPMADLTRCQEHGAPE